MNEQLKITNEWTNEDEIVSLKISSSENNNLSIHLFDEEGLPYCEVTKEFESLAPYQAYLTNTPNIINFIEENGLAKPLNVYKKNGFCSYPLYEFNKELLFYYAPYGIKQYEQGLKNIKPQKRVDKEFFFALGNAHSKKVSR